MLRTQQLGIAFQRATFLFTRLRNLCQQRVIAEFRLQAMDRAKLRTEVWTSAVAGR